MKIPFKDEELKKYIKNYNKNTKNLNGNKSQRINNFLNISNNAKILSANQKYGKSYLKSFCSTSTNNNSSNINKSSMHLNKSKPKNVNNKNKKKHFYNIILPNKMTTAPQIIQLVSAFIQILIIQQNQIIFY